MRLLVNRLLIGPGSINSQHPRGVTGLAGGLATLMLGNSNNGYTGDAGRKNGPSEHRA